MTSSKKNGRKTERRSVTGPSEGRHSQGSESDLTQRILLSNIRHELRAPLNAIIGYSEILMEDAEDIDLQDFIPDLQKIHSAGKEMLELVNENLNPSNIDTEQVELCLDNLEAELTHALRTPLNAIIGYIEMLIENAVFLGQEGFISDLKKIHKASKRFLELIKDIVFFSKMETEVIAIDLLSSKTSDIIKEVVNTISPTLDVETHILAVDRSSMLVVDDNEMNRDLLSRHLERQGHIVTIAENGRQALEIMKTRTFDLILLDIIMPEMNGLQVLKQLKDNETWRDVPVIMISALDEMDGVIRCIEIGADDYLTKPFNPVLLRARINSSLEKKRLHDLEKEQKRILKEMFGKYVADEVRDEVLSGRIPLDGELKDVTVLFADIRNFTPLTESTPPRDVVRILNDYFTEITPAISRHRGSLLRYVGDEIYAVFGAPLHIKNHSIHAVKAALEMRSLLVVVNERLNQQGYPSIEHGVGIHTGPVVAANIGSPNRLVYDLVGDTVNLASRIQGLTKTFAVDILISAATRTSLDDSFVVEKLPATMVKGKTDPVKIYKVL
jgi:class 3 adenylate cyclase/signal transduction histidine kinase